MCIRDSSFTSLSERLSPAENFRFINSYLGLMGPVIRRNRGIIDKFIGDAIMALFQVEPDDAVCGALEMIRSLRWYNQGRSRAGYSSVRIGIGIHSGNVMLGTIGEHYRMESSVVSDAVNLASRIEMLTKPFKTDLLISEGTYDGLKDPSQYMIRLVDMRKVRGRSLLVKLYEVFDEEYEDLREFKKENLELFELAVKSFHASEFGGLAPNLSIWLQWELRIALWSFIWNALNTLRNMVMMPRSMSISKPIRII